MAAPRRPALHALLGGLARFSLDAGLLDNAQFLGERMAAQFPGDGDALFLLASAHFRRGRHATVLALLRAAPGPRARFLLAQSCRALGRLQEAEMHMHDLLRDPAGMPAADRALRVDVDRSAALCLQGYICKDANRTDQAKEYFTAALQANPFLFCALQALCQMGWLTSNPDACSAHVSCSGSLVARQRRRCRYHL